jgi:glucosamine kinase
MSKNAYLGIDVGGTASRWVLIDTDGEKIASGTAPGATGHLFAEAPRRSFIAMIEAVAAETAGVAPLTALHAGVTGLGTPAMAEARAIVASAFAIDPAAITLADDMDLAFRACFAPGEGHIVSAGTGSIGIHLTAHGEVIRVGGRGLLIDDGGSGTWIALTALDRLYRLLDEHGRPEGAEILAEALFTAIGGAAWDDVRSFVYASDRGRIGTLSRAVADAAETGDGLALRILTDASHELARLAHALIARAGILPVAFVGGVINLHPSIRPSLVAALPGIEVRFPTIDAALTAAMIARAGMTTE